MLILISYNVRDQRSTRVLSKKLSLETRERSGWMGLMPIFILESSARASGSLYTTPSLPPAPRDKTLAVSQTAVHALVETTSSLALP